MSSHDSSAHVGCRRYLQLFLLARLQILPLLADLAHITLMLLNELSSAFRQSSDTFFPPFLRCWVALGREITPPRTLSSTLWRSAGVALHGPP